jgi:hypothetical protein
VPFGPHQAPGSKRRHTTLMIRASTRRERGCTPPDWHAKVDSGIDSHAPDGSLLRLRRRSMPEAASSSCPAPTRCHVISATWARCDRVCLVAICCTAPTSGCCPACTWLCVCCPFFISLDMKAAERLPAGRAAACAKPDHPSVQHLNKVKVS